MDILNVYMVNVSPTVMNQYAKPNTMAMLNASMVPVSLIVMSTSASTNIMDMLNVLTENAFLTAI